MKRVFWLLVIINLGLLVYFSIELILPGKPEIRLSEIQPEKIKVLSQTEIDSLPGKTTPSPSEQIINTPEPVAICFEWGIFSDTNLSKAQKALAKIDLQASVREQNSEQPKRYWVYSPPAKTAAAAQKKAAELKALGIDDLFIVQEEKWKNAISFGIFEDELLADKLMQELKAKGVKNIEKAPRSNGKGQHSLIFSKLNENDISELNKLKPDFPMTALKEIACN